jgi:hypothetical protein
MRPSVPQRLRAVRAILILGAGLCGSAPEVSAQSSDTNRVSAGDTVRVRMDRGLTVEAVFQRWEGESMALSVEGLTAPWVVSVFDMQALDVYTDRTRREGFRHGALLGAAAGLFLGAAIGVALNASGATDDPDAPADQIVTEGPRVRNLPGSPPGSRLDRSGAPDPLSRARSDERASDHPFAPSGT